MPEVHLERIENSLSGSLGDRRVDLVLDVPNSQTSIRGTCLDVPIDGHWRIESNHDNLDPVGLFLGHYGGEPVYLRNELHLTSHYSVRHADLSGTIADHALHARITAVEAPAHGPSVVGIDGEFDGETISVYVASTANLSDIHVDGVVGGRQIKLEVTRRSIRGEYAGPDALFGVFVCTPLYFL